MKYFHSPHSVLKKRKKKLVKIKKCVIFCCVDCITREIDRVLKTLWFLSFRIGNVIEKWVCNKTHWTYSIRLFSFVFSLFNTPYYKPISLRYYQSWNSGFRGFWVFNSTDSPCTSETLDSAFLLTSINDSILLRWAEAAVSSIELVCADVMVGFTTATKII